MNALEVNLRELIPEIYKVKITKDVDMNGSRGTKYETFIQNENGRKYVFICQLSNTVTKAGEVADILYSHLRHWREDAEALG